MSRSSCCLFSSTLRASWLKPGGRGPGSGCRNMDCAAAFVAVPVAVAALTVIQRAMRRESFVRGGPSGYGGRAARGGFGGCCARVSRTHGWSWLYALPRRVWRCGSSMAPYLACGSGGCAMIGGPAGHRTRLAVGLDLTCAAEQRARVLFSSRGHGDDDEQGGRARERRTAS
jgi:hypothetical protein